MRRFIAALFNIIAAIIAIGSICVAQIEFPKGDLTAILNSPPFEESSDFARILEDRINDVFTYSSLKACFEKDNEINYDIIVAESLSKNGVLKKWTIGNCVDEATAHGLYIDTDNTVKRRTGKDIIGFDRNISYNFLFKTYPSKTRIGVSFEEEFLNEFMTALANYYGSKSHLNPNSNFSYRINFINRDTNVSEIEISNTDISNNKFLESNAYVFLASKEGLISSNVKMIDSNLLNNTLNNNPHPDKELIMCCSVNTSYPYNDQFKEKYSEYETQKTYCAMLLTTILLSSFLFIITMILTLIFILRAKKTIDETKRVFFSIPTEIHCAIYIIITISLIFASRKIINNNTFTTKDLTSITPYVYILCIYCTTILFFTTLTSKYVDDTLTPISMKSLRENSKIGDNPLNPHLLFIFIFIPIIVFFVIAIYLIYLCTLINNTILLFLGIILLFSSIVFIIYLLTLHDAFYKALSIQIKSNEMRTSLIANVSHDIKTPLTSILNYTNLLSTELETPTENFKDNALQYSKVIINKSNRLNTLINDLIFDSKVSSGNLEIKLEKLDLNSFLTQILLEFEDRLNEKELKTIYENKSDYSIVQADSSQLYRVFQNLFSNIYKYALEKSRVYVDLEHKGNKIIITLKNIIKENIEVNVDSLTDRFVRGNKSRTTEGFGLGLSIAENLIKSMHGKFDIKNEKDEFITKITFLAYEE